VPSGRLVQRPEIGPGTQAEQYGDHFLWAECIHPGCVPQRNDFTSGCDVFSGYLDRRRRPSIRLSPPRAARSRRPIQSGTLYLLRNRFHGARAVTSARRSCGLGVARLLPENQRDSVGVKLTAADGRIRNAVMTSVDHTRILQIYATTGFSKPPPRLFCYVSASLVAVLA